MSLSDAERTKLEGYLSEAETAFHQLMIGGGSVSISSGGKSVSFSAANKADLRNYIAELKRQLGVKVDVARPIRPIF